MRKTVLFIAMSLDGYIADRKGGVGWLEEYGGQKEEDSYSRFVRDVDTVLMGWNTYHQIVTELSPDAWVYQGLTSYVITHNPKKDLENIHFTATDPCALVRALKMERGKQIWICGGADLARQLMTENLIDLYRIFIIPILLGGGVRLFGEMDAALRLRFQEVREDQGIVEVIYESAPSNP